MSGNEAYNAAVQRVDGTPELETYRDLLIGYDWPNTEEHLRWVATAAVDEIVDWARGIRQDEIDA